jgi:hypothetical protein
MVESLLFLPEGKAIESVLEFGQIQPESIRQSELWLVQVNAASAGSEDQPVSPNWSGDNMPSSARRQCFLSISVLERLRVY